MRALMLVVMADAGVSKADYKFGGFRANGVLNKGTNYRSNDLHTSPLEVRSYNDKSILRGE